MTRRYINTFDLIWFKRDHTEGFKPPTIESLKQKSSIQGPKAAIHLNYYNQRHKLQTCYGEHVVDLQAFRQFI